MILLATLSMTEYGIIGLVLAAVFGMLQKQMQFSNKMAVEQAKRREEDLDKISAALIITTEQERAQAELMKEITDTIRKVTLTQELLAKDMETVKTLQLNKMELLHDIHARLSKQS